MNLELKSSADFKKSEQVINTNHLCKFKIYKHKTIYFATTQKDTKRYTLQWFSMGWERSRLWN